MGDRGIGANEPCFLIAEAGVNHNGDVRRALKLVEAAAQAGVDAVKFQTFTADQITTDSTPKAEYQRETTDPGESQREMLRRLELPPEAHRKLQAGCQERGILFLSTPYDEAGADLLEELGVPLFKIGSGEVTNWPFLQYVARKGKPILLSTGMTFLSEVEEAVGVIQKAGNEDLVLLHCVSTYPAKPADANLRAMTTLAKAFEVPVGFSDHTLGVEVALAAVALGASVIEKHFTLDRALPGPDHRASLEPEELRQLVESIRQVERALGSGKKEPVDAELANRALGRRSLVAAEVIEPGTVITREMVTAKRPEGGISPTRLQWLLGKKARTRILQDTHIVEDMVE